MSSYPGAIDEFRVTQNLPGIVYNADDKKTIFAEDTNAHSDAIVAIEQTLGKNPQGNYDTVADRLDASGGGSPIIFATSSTASATQLKVCTTDVGDYVPAYGDIVVVKFTAGQHYASASTNFASIMFNFDGIAGNKSLANIDGSSVLSSSVWVPANGTITMRYTGDWFVPIDNNSTTATISTVVMQNTRQYASPSILTIQPGAAGGGSFLQYIVYALARDMTINVSSAAVYNTYFGVRMLVIIKDNGTARNLTWTTTNLSQTDQFALPTTTTPGKTLVVELLSVGPNLGKVIPVNVMEYELI